MEDCGNGGTASTTTVAAVAEDAGVSAATGTAGGSGPQAMDIVVGAPATVSSAAEPVTLPSVMPVEYVRLMNSFLETSSSKIADATTARAANAGTTPTAPAAAAALNAGPTTIGIAEVAIAAETPASIVSATMSMSVDPCPPADMMPMVSGAANFMIMDVDPPVAGVSPPSKNGVLVTSSTCAVAVTVSAHPSTDAAAVRPSVDAARPSAPLGTYAAGAIIPPLQAGAAAIMTPPSRNAATATAPLSTGDAAATPAATTTAAHLIADAVQDASAPPGTANALAVAAASAHPTADAMASMTPSMAAAPAAAAVNQTGADAAAPATSQPCSDAEAKLDKPDDSRAKRRKSNDGSPVASEHEIVYLDDSDDESQHASDDEVVFVEACVRRKGHKDNRRGVPGKRGGGRYSPRANSPRNGANLEENRGCGAEVVKLGGMETGKGGAEQGSESEGGRSGLRANSGRKAGEREEKHQAREGKDTNGSASSRSVNSCDERRAGRGRAKDGGGVSGGGSDGGGKRKRSGGKARQVQSRSSSGESHQDSEAVENVGYAGTGSGLTAQSKGGGKRRNIAVKQMDRNAMIAASMGFPVDSLMEEEIEAGLISTLHESEQFAYISVRNQILARWRDDVSRFLTEDEIMKTVPAQHLSLVPSTYKFLRMKGYINFGVAPALNQRPAPPLGIKKTVVVLGAGLAGLAAARQLLSFGLQVVVLEARQRPGGRVYTKKVEGSGRVAMADLGGSVLTGIQGNPLGVLARQLGFDLHKIRDNCPLFQPDGHPVDEELDVKVEHQFNRLLDVASSWRGRMESMSAQCVSLGTTLEFLRNDYKIGKTAEEKQLFEWHLANLEYANAGLLSELSLAFWDQDDPYEMSGDHCFLPGGNVRLVSALADGIPIFYNSMVQSVKYGKEGVKVTCRPVGGDEPRVFEGDMALCTIPLGVLKKRSIKFDPELPQRKLEAINKLGFGLLNKVVMLFPYTFWNEDLDTFGHLVEDPDRRGEFFLFYSYAPVSGGSLLLALVAGAAAVRFEQVPAQESVTRLMEVLRGIFEPKGIKVPYPLQTVCTRWGSDPLCLGSYSHVAVGASGEDYDILAESVDDCLFFAGEATIRRYPATMHGAFLSGLREAGNIVNSAFASGTPAEVEERVPSDVQTCASTLSELFEQPDVEFGCFGVIFDPRSMAATSSALIRVVVRGAEPMKTVGGVAGSSGTAQEEQLLQLHLYSVILRWQAVELREVKGGDNVRLHILTERYGVKLVGRRGLGPTGDSLVAAVRAARAARAARKAVIAATAGLGGGGGTGVATTGGSGKASFSSRTPFDAPGSLSLVTAA